MDDAKVIQAKELHEYIQKQSIYLTKLEGTSRDITIPTIVNRVLYDKTAPGGYFLLQNGKIVLDQQDIKKILAARLSQGPNAALEQDAVIAVAEDEILRVLPNGQYANPNIAQQLNSLNEGERKKALTKFSGGITKSLVDTFGTSEKQDKGESDFDIFSKRLSVDLKNGISRLFATTSFEKPHSGNQEKIFLNEVYHNYLPLIEADPENFSYSFVGAGILVGVLVEHEGEENYIIVGKVRFDKKTRLDDSNPGNGLEVNELRIYDREVEDFSNISTERRSGQAGHLRSVATQFSEAKFSQYKALIEGGVVPGTTIALSAEFLQAARAEILAAENIFKDLIALDRVFLTPAAAQGKPDLTPYIQVARLLGETEIILVEKTSPGATPTTNKIDMQVQLTARTFNPYEYPMANAALKGSLQRVLKNNMMKHLKLIAQAYAHYHLGMPKSSSMLTEAIMRQLAVSLKPLVGLAGERELLNALDPRTSHSNTLATLKLPKNTIIDMGSMLPLLKQQGEAIRSIMASYATKAEHEAVLKKKSLATKRKQRRKAFKAMRDISDTQNIDFTSIVSQINAELKAEVISNMVHPRLINRTGRLASSSRLLNASFEKMEFTYRRSPYQVFSNRVGKAPWQNRYRDPESLIRKSINNIIKAKFPGVFRPNVYIKGV